MARPGKSAFRSGGADGGLYMNRYVVVGGAAIAILAAVLAVVWSLQASRIDVTDARIVLARDGTGALAYMTLHNSGDASDRLLGVTTPMAGEAAVHSHGTDAATGPGVDAGGTLSLSPDGPHIVLGRLHADLAAGGTAPLTLVFQRAGEVTVAAAVISAADAPAGEGHSHDHGGIVAAPAHHHAHDALVEAPDGAEAPSIAVELAPDPVGGWTLHVITERFTFAPEHANTAHVFGEGHAHLYVDGEKLARLYGPWFHIPTLPPGEHELTVTLNANDHRVYGQNGRPIQAVVTVTVD